MCSSAANTAKLYDMTPDKAPIQACKPARNAETKSRTFTYFAAANSGECTNTVSRMVIDTTTILDHRCMNIDDDIYSSSVHCPVESTADPPLFMHAQLLRRTWRFNLMRTIYFPICTTPSGRIGRSISQRASFFFFLSQCSHIGFQSTL